MIIQIQKTNLSTLAVWIALPLFGMILIVGCGPGRVMTPMQVAESIRQTYDSSMFDFDTDIQRHYAVRLYRMTGDHAYEQLIFRDALKRISELDDDLTEVDNPRYVISRCAELRERINPKTRKGRIRVEMFKKWVDIDFYLNLLYNTNLLQEFCLQGQDDNKSVFDRAKRILNNIDFSEFLSDTAVIRVYSPQAINYVYYLMDLDLADLRLEYKRNFREVFADDYDDQLSRNQYMDKIYGLTHFITSASRYYQEPVDSLEFAWVIDYFTRSQRRIFDKATADIIAEVGICYLLAGYQDHPVVEKCRRFLLDRFDYRRKLIPSPSGNIDLQNGEHRNVLALMLLSWPDKLTSGPCQP